MWSTGCLPPRAAARKPLNRHWLPICWAARAAAVAPNATAFIAIATLRLDPASVCSDSCSSRTSIAGIPAGVCRSADISAMRAARSSWFTSSRRACSLRLVLLLLGLAGLFALHGLHHRRRAGVGLLAHHGQEAQHGIVDAERMLQFVHHVLARFDVQAQVVRLRELVDLVGQLATAPVLATVHLAVAGGDHALVAFQHGRNLFALVRVDQENDLVMTHKTPFGLELPRRLDGCSKKVSPRL